MPVEKYTALMKGEKFRFDIFIEMKKTAEKRK
jgi:hypothetical protein